MNSPKQLANYLKEYFVSKLGNNTIKGSLFAGQSGLTIGSTSIPFSDLYVNNLHASIIAGTLSGSEWEYAGNIVIDANDASDTTVSIVNQGAGLASLSVENNLSVGGNFTITGTINGIDITTHAADVNAHHAKSHVLATTSALGADHTVSGLTSGYVLRAFGATTAYFGQLNFSDLVGTVSNAQATQFLLLDGTRVMTGGFVSSAGTVSAVGVGIGASNTGFFKSATNYINVSIGGTEKGRWTATGLRIGGATDPAEALDITGNILVSGNLTVGSNTDIITTLGRGKLGYIASGTDVFNLSHFDMFTTTSYALKQDNVGNTTINAANTRTLSLTVNNSNIVAITGTSVRTYTDVGINKAPSVALDVSGAIAGDSTLTTIGAINGAINTNTASQLGYAVIGYVGHNGYAGFAADGFDTSSSYALIQGATNGSTYLNTASGQTIYHRVNNLTIMSMANAGLTFADTKHAASASYVSGWAGNGWRIDDNLSISGESFAEFDNLSIRGTLSVYELVINQIRATNGSLFVSSSAKINTVSGSNWTFEDPEASNLCPFLVNDLVIIQDVDINSTTLVRRIVRRVSAVSGNTITVTAASGGPTDVGGPRAGDVVVRFGSSSNAARQGTVMLTSDMSNSPYMDIISGVTSWADWTGGTKTKLRIGLLSGLSVGSANEYGFAASYDGFGTTNSWVKVSTSGAQFNNIPIKSYNGANQTFNLSSIGTDFWIGVSSGDKRIVWDGATLSITGTITATAGIIGGWTIASNTLASTDFVIDAGNSKMSVGASTTFGTKGFQVERNGSFPRVYIGSGTTQYFQYDGTKITWAAANTSLDASGNLSASSATLSGAITATSGSISGFLTIGTSGGIYQGSGSAGTPTTGLKIWNIGGVGKIAGYNAGTIQWYGDTDGKLYAGGGDIVFDENGITYPTTITGSPILRARYGTGGTEIGREYAYAESGGGRYDIVFRDYNDSITGIGEVRLISASPTWVERSSFNVRSSVLHGFTYINTKLYIGFTKSQIDSNDLYPNLSSITARGTTASSISMASTSSGNAAHIGFNTYMSDVSGSYSASGAWKFFGSQYTGNVTAPGRLTFDGNSNYFYFAVGETGLSSGSDITTWSTKLTIGDDIFNWKGNTDNTAFLGRAKIGYVGYSDFAGFAHYDFASAGNYALLQNSSGITFLNSASGQRTRFRINNTAVANLGATGLRVGDDNAATEILDIVGNATISGSINVGSFAASWAALTYNTNWSSFGGSYGSVRYCKIGDLVIVNGMAKRSSGSAITTVGTLPSGYRPSTQKSWYTSMNVAGVESASRVDVTTGGSISITNTTTSSIDYLSLDCICFRTNS